MPMKSLRNIVCEEIALEGLDGITFPALWLRLSHRTQQEGPFPDSFKQYIWDICRKTSYHTFFVLPAPRPDVVIFNRLEVKNEDEVPNDVYPHAPVDDQKKMIRGSCETYQTRETITKTAKKTKSFETLYQQWGTRLVVVSSQKVREEALTGKKGNLTNFTTVRFCLLERIGRSRYYGEIAYGKNSLAAMREDPKTLFYHRKVLLHAKYITKQSYHQKIEKLSYTGTLLHLRRFYVEQKPKYLRMTELVVDYLRKKENHRALYDDIKLLANSNCLRKLFKTPEFQLFVRTDLKVPYRLMFPDATPKEWKLKGAEKEKMLRCMELIDTNMTVREHWPSKQEADHDEDHITFLDYHRLQLFTPFITQANTVVRQFEGEGCSQTELGLHLGAPRLMARSMTRNLLRSGMVCAFMNDAGRQRVTKFCYREFQETGNLAIKFNIERNRAIDLLINMKDKTCDVVEPSVSYKSMSDWESLPPVTISDVCDQTDDDRPKVFVIPNNSGTVKKYGKKMKTSTGSSSVSSDVPCEMPVDEIKMEVMEDEDV